MTQGASIQQIAGVVWAPPAPVPCQADPDLWADPKLPPGRGAPSRDRMGELELWAAKQCDTVCPFRDECLAGVMAEERSKGSTYRHGIRGGTFPFERTKMDPTVPKRKRATA